MAELDLGVGFVPRVDGRNYRGVETTLGLAASPTLFGPDLDLPWLIVEGPWAAREPSLLAHRDELGFQFLVDVQPWRYAFDATFDVAKFADASWAPPGPLDLGDEVPLREFATGVVRAQCNLRADALLVPGFVPRGRDDDVTKPTLVAVDAAHSVADREMIAFVGVHRSALDAGRRVIAELPAYISAVYVQFTPLRPLIDSTELLLDMTRVLLEARDRDLKVVAGRFGALATTLATLGIHAADAGLAEGESYDLGSKLRTAKRASTDSERSPMPGGRVYVPALGQSFAAADYRRLESVPNVRPYLECQLPCCRYAQLRDAPGRAFRHALWARRHESAVLLALPQSMRFDAEIRRMEQVRSNRTAVNHALDAAGEALLSGDHIDRHLALLHRLADAGAVAA